VLATVTKEQRREFRKDMQDYKKFQYRGTVFFYSKKERKKPGFEEQMEELRSREHELVSSLMWKYGDDKVAKSVEKRGNSMRRAFLIAAGSTLVLAFAVPKALQILGAMQPDIALATAMAIINTAIIIWGAGRIISEHLADKPLVTYEQLAEDAEKLFGTIGIWKN